MIARLLIGAGVALMLSQVFSTVASPSVFGAGLVAALVGGCFVVDELERQS